MRGAKDSTNDNVLSDLSIRVILALKLEFDGVGVVVAKVREFYLEDTVFIGFNISQSTRVARHSCGHCHIFNRELIEAIEDFTDHEGVLGARQVLINWHVYNFYLVCSFDFHVLTDCHGN